jgi:hypothetical protein
MMICPITLRQRVVPWLFGDIHGFGRMTSGRGLAWRWRSTDWRMCRAMATCWQFGRYDLTIVVTGQPRPVSIRPFRHRLAMQAMARDVNARRPTRPLRPPKGENINFIYSSEGVYISDYSTQNNTFNQLGTADGRTLRFSDIRINCSSALEPRPTCRGPPATGTQAPIQAGRPPGAPRRPGSVPVPCSARPTTGPRTTLKGHYRN